MGGSSSDPNKAAMKAQKDQMSRLDKISLPELEKLALESPELVGLLDPEQLDPSALEAIQTDPKLKGMQMQALEGLQERAESGITTEDKYMMEDLLGQAAGQEKSQREGIEQEMARRGTGGSGQELMMKLQAQQASGNQGRKQAMQMAQQAAQGKQQALAQMQQAAGQMEGADYARQAGAASAKDRIAAANAQNRQMVSGQNLSARQAIANQKSAIANQNQMYNKNIAQQQYQNELSKAGAQGGVASNMSSIAGSAAQKPGGIQSGLAGAATGAQIGSAMGPAGAGYGAAIGAGAGLLSSMEDGGIAQADARRPADVQRDMQAEYKENEDKQHNQFKKKYMRQVRSELMAPAEEDRKEVTRTGGDKVKAADGAMFNMDKIKAHGQDPSQLNRPEMQMTEEYAKNNVSDIPEASSIDSKKLTAGLGALSKIIGDGKPKARVAPKLNTGAINVPEVTLGRNMKEVQFGNPFSAADGGVAEYECGGIHKDEDDTMYASDGEGDIVDSGMESYAGDRVDAKINDGEAVLNVPQQQRFMDLVRGKIGVNELGDEDIVEGVPRDFSEDLHEELEDESNGESGENNKLEGLKRLLEALGSN